MPIVFEEVVAEITPGADTGAQQEDTDGPREPTPDPERTSRDLAALVRRAARLVAD